MGLKTTDAIRDLRVTVSVPGTPVQISDESAHCVELWLTALHSNTSPVAFGTENVDGSAAGERGPWREPGELAILKDVDWSDFRVDAQVAGEGFSVFAQIRRVE